jgi:hypothetical protein
MLNNQRVTNQQSIVGFANVLKNTQSRQ